ncbi:hypothetical protein SDRG_00982 [Saprolegnia diclina VS20]|uniref:BAR domain-containing protein n=1 Tax=Saprolegnia diclina (strain VS20) TaxID=1156394 RepID=T0SGS4_SAPDV|nr:hypothetical protein SDRG_00982 [Saprolegnia diclina VS20]EQC42142.1 hypothetical protein SDRG_00982 [Saprolegnia diclina VS20]|eukprot:XP_008604711.1 hypothetical protein SDRG_00982 [Saprolegnia diclina VS20]
MSSIRVRATNKLMAKLGATKPSKNTQFDIAAAGFEELQSGVVNLDNALQGFILSLKGFHASANVLLRAVEDVASVRCSDNMGTAPEVRQFVDVFKACSLSIDITKLTELVKTFETRVQKPSQGWLHQVAHLKSEIEDFNDSHITFDHYTKKVQTLRDAHNKRAGAGKQEKSKDVDKLHRNEQKLVTISTNYNKTSEKTIQDLRTFLQNRDATLLPLVQRIIEFRLAYAKDVYDLTAKLDPLLRISTFNEHLSRLESFAPSGHDSAIPAATRTDDEPEVQVTTLSFNDFVGPTTEAPPSADFFQAPATQHGSVTSSHATHLSSGSSWQDFNAPSASPAFEASFPSASGNHITTSAVAGSRTSFNSTTTAARTGSIKADGGFPAFHAPDEAGFNPFAATPPPSFSEAPPMNPFGASAFPPPPPTTPQDSFNFMQ